MDASRDHLEEGGFPRTVPPEYRIAFIFFKTAAELPEDPFGVELFAGTGKYNVHREKMIGVAGTLQYGLFFTDF